jgi:hypothetical protein
MMAHPAVVLDLGGETARGLACGNRSCAVVTSKSGSALCWTASADRAAGDADGSPVRGGLADAPPRRPVREAVRAHPCFCDGALSMMLFERVCVCSRRRLRSCRWTCR